MKNALALLLVIIVGMFFYSLTFRGVWGNPTYGNTLYDYPGSPFESSHEKSPYAMLLAYSKNGTFTLDQELADFGAPDVSYYKGKFYSFFPPGLPAVLLPFYLIGTQYNLAQVVTYAVMVVFSILSLIMVYVISRDVFKLPIWAGFLSALLFGFGTTAWSYAITIYQHPLTTLLLLLSFYGVFRYRTRACWSWLWGIVVWSCYGLAIVVDYPNAILLLPVMIYFAISSVNFKRLEDKYLIGLRWSIILTMIFFIGLSFWHGYYNYTNYGDWKKISQSFPRYERDKFDVLMQKVAQAEEDAKNGVVTKTAILQEQAILQSSPTLVYADDKGIFFFSPVLLLGIIGFIFALKRHPLEASVFGATALVNLIIYSSFYDPWGGWAFGPRYLIPAMPILAIFTVYFLVHTTKRLISLVIFYLLFVYSAGVALLGVLTSNIVPPKIEAEYFKMPYHNYLLNLEFLNQGKTGSMVFLNYFSHRYNLVDYYMFIYLTLLLIVLVLVVYAYNAERIHDVHN